MKDGVEEAYTSPIQALRAASLLRRRVAKLLGWLATGRSVRIAQALRSHYQLYVPAGLRARVPHRVSHTPNRWIVKRTTDYAAWIALNDTLTDRDRAAIASQIETFGIRPTFSILMPVFSAPRPSP